jgi:hypothetical protein
MKIIRVLNERNIFKQKLLCDVPIHTRFRFLTTPQYMLLINEINNYNIQSYISLTIS